MKKLWIGLMVLIGLLAGCGAGAQNVESARSFLDAINTGDEEAAREYLCAEEVEETIAGIASVSADERQTWSMQNINCSAAGEDVRCTYQITMELEDGTQETTSADVVFNVENGVICGFEEPIGE